MIARSTGAAEQEPVTGHSWLPRFTAEHLMRRMPSLSMPFASRRPFKV